MSRRAVAVAVLVALLAGADDAFGRVGGGQGFGTGGGGFSGGSGGDGDGLALVVWFLIRLVVVYPEVGIPLVLLFLVGLALRSWFTAGDRARQVHRVRRALAPGPRPRRADATAWLAAHDPGFSEPVLLELLQLIHRRALEAHGTGAWAPLSPFVATGVRDDLARDLPDVAAVRDVVHAGIRVERARRVGDDVEIAVTFLGSRVEALPDGPRPTYAEERWTFRRRADARALPPDEALRLGCPACGAAVDTDEMGACTYCHTPIADSRLQWQACSATVLVRRRADPPTVSRFAGGDEPGVHVPTLRDPGLAAAFRAFLGRHPDFDPEAFRRRVERTFLSLQASWSAMRWEEARPHVTGPLYDTLRFTLEGYRRHGLVNRVEDVRLERVEIVRIQQDAWYDAITVRLWASARDWTEDADGRVVGGNRRVRRRFSEYWTFLRATGSGASAADGIHCPSCGAPLDRVNAAGVCGYCDTRITTGRFDWVLSRIDQPQVYQG